MVWTFSLAFYLSSAVYNILCQVVDDEIPPKITSVFKNEYYFPVSTVLTNAKIECQAKHARIQYEWRKDNVTVQPSEFVSVNTSTGTLSFNKIRNSDYGTYQCFASNEAGTSISKTFEVKKADIGIFTSDDTAEVQCRQFELCKIPCRGKPHCRPDSQCKIEWNIGEGTQNVRLSERVGNDDNGFLYFSWTNTSDWTGLDYRCGVWQEQLNKLVLGSPIRLNILDAEKYSELDHFPRVLITSNDTVQYGGEGILQCMFSGYPTAKIEWITPKMELINTNSSKFDLTDYNRILRIKDAITEDEGNYTCKGIWNNKTFLNPVYLNVTSLPVLDLRSGNPQMKDTLALVGQNAKFYCEVVSLQGEQPPSSPKWMKDGEELQIHVYGEKYTLSENNKVLSVVNVQKVDSGVYQCISENSEGIMLKEAILKVIEKPSKPFIVGDLEPKTYTYSTLTCSNRQNSFFDCYTEDFPSLYTWYVNETILKKATNKTYRFNVTKALKYNRFSCQVLESDRSDQVQVNPLYGPEKGDLMISPPIRDKMSLCDGDTIGPYTCAVDCNPPCSVQWKYIKSPGQLVNATPLSYNSVTLLKRQVGREEMTMIKCVTKGRQNKSESLTMNMEIQYLSDPKVFMNGLPKNLSVIQENTRLHLSCLVEGNTVPTITIYTGKENRTLGKRDGQQFNYTFEKAHCFDTNMYRCQGTSYLCWTKEKTFSINVLCKPRLDSKATFKYTYKTIEVPVFISIKVPVISNPKPASVQWHGAYPNPGIVTTITQRNKIFQHWVSSTFPIYNKSFLGNYVLYLDDEEITTIYINEERTSLIKPKIWIIVGVLSGLVFILVITISLYRIHHLRVTTLSSNRHPGVATVNRECQDPTAEAHAGPEDQSNEYEDIDDSGVEKRQSIRESEKMELQSLSKEQTNQYEVLNI